MYKINILSFNSKFVTVTYEGFWGVRDTAPSENGNKYAIVEIIIIIIIIIIKLLLFICSKIFVSPVTKTLKVRVCKTVFCNLFYTELYLAWFQASASK